MRRPEIIPLEGELRVVIAGQEMISLEAIRVMAGCVIVDRLPAEPAHGPCFLVVRLERGRELSPCACTDVTSHSCLPHIQLCEVCAPLGQVARCLWLEVVDELDEIFDVACYPGFVTVIVVGCNDVRSVGRDDAAFSRRTAAFIFVVGMFQTPWPWILFEEFHGSILPYVLLPCPDDPGVNIVSWHGGEGGDLLCVVVGQGVVHLAGLEPAGREL